MAAHSVFTIVAKVAPGHVAQLATVLAAIQADIDNAFANPNPLFDFRTLAKLHFASFVIFDDKTPEPLLVFENSVDDSEAEYLSELMSWVGPGIDEVYKHCVDYPVSGTPADKLDYLKQRVRWPQLHHVGAAYRTASSIRSDRQLRQRLDARVDALTNALSPSTLWQQLQCEFPVAPGREGRAWEQVKNWTTMLSLVPILAVAIWSLWDRPSYLVGFLALLFTLKALWLLALVGWPMGGKIRKEFLFVPAAMFGGMFLGAWPWKPLLPIYTALVVLGAVAAYLAARALPTRQARQTRGNWPVWLFIGMAAGFSWLAVDVVHNVVPSIVRSFVRALVILPSYLTLPPMMTWLTLTWPTWLATTALWILAVVNFVAIFVGLVSASAMPPAQQRVTSLRYAIIVIGGGVGALLFWAVTAAGWWAPWPAAFVLSAVSLVELFALWDLPLPSPEIKVDPIDRAALQRLERQEDKDLQNHMAVMVRIRKPHRGRRFLLILFLRTLDLVFYRTVLPDTWYRSSLFGVPTVHFAQWTVLDDTRHMFLSNYDLSWSVYLNDFGERLTYGIQKIWGQSEGCPGVSDLEKFKQFVRTRMVPYQVWYRAYPGLTTEQIQNNEQIRLGLAKTSVDEETSVELLRRLSHIERR